MHGGELGPVQGTGLGAGSRRSVAVAGEERGGGGAAGAPPLTEVGHLISSLSVLFC